MASSASLTFAVTGELPLHEATIRLHPADNVVIARTSLQADTRLTGDAGDIVVKQTIPVGHKLAVAPIASGDAVRRYGQIIGFATRAIEPGDHVHTHNLSHVGRVSIPTANGGYGKPPCVSRGSRTSRFAGVT